MIYRWSNETQIQAKSYKCGYCSREVSSSVGYSRETSVVIAICPQCDQPTYFNFRKQVPEPMPGATISHVPKDVENLYDEARKCIGVGAATASMMVSRKILMNVAVHQGAKMNQNFQDYVDYIEANHLVPPGSNGWLTFIRQHGNIATHEIESLTLDDATHVLYFVESLLRIVYELPGKAPKLSAKNS